MKKTFKKYLSAKNILIFCMIIGFLVYLFTEWGPQLWAFFEDTDKIRELVKRAGPLGWVIFIFLQAFQVVFAPIPGNVTGAVGGAIFGWWGLLLTVIGSALGLAAVVALSRRFGRPLIEKMFRQKDVKKLDWILDHPSVEVVLFLIFLFPMMPDDIVGYFAGLTKIRFRNIILISIIGKMPMQLVTNLFGANLLDGSWWTLAIITSGICLLALLIIIKRKWFLEFLRSDNHRQYFKDSISRKNMVKSKKNVTKNNSK